MTVPLFFCLTSKQSFTIIYVNVRLLNGGFVLKDTKERILESALKLFATDGYEAVSVSMIAGELGITKGALYRHYKNKRDIFGSILKRMEQNDFDGAGEYDLPQTNNQDEYGGISFKNFAEYSKMQFRYWTENEFASSFRKMLTVEQYRSEEMSELYSQYLASGPLGYVQSIFVSFGIKNAAQKAIEFYSPMFLLYSVYDSAKDKSEVIAALDNYVDNFELRNDF